MTRASDIRTAKHLTRLIDAGEKQVEPAKWQRAEVFARLADEMTQRDIAAEVGLKDHRAVGIAIAVWNRFGGVRPQERPVYTEAYYQARGNTGNDTNAPRKKMTLTEKVELVRELVADPVIRAAVEPQMSEPLPTVRHAAPTLTEAWESWLNRLNSLLTDGAKLSDRGDEERLSAYAESARMFYERITERQLDAEIRAFFEEVEA